ncbi:Hypothetical predicted protein [Scomber scombrus]|uniref:Uncharacterized protein n=1 Tax=Scomber scombrus TaxID=13677 RepID=A0AAV1P7L4_SCOSC
MLNNAARPLSFRPLHLQGVTSPAEQLDGPDITANVHQHEEKQQRDTLMSDNLHVLEKPFRKLSQIHQYATAVFTQRSTHIQRKKTTDGDLRWQIGPPGSRLCSLIRFSDHVQAPMYSHVKCFMQYGSSLTSAEREFMHTQSQNFITSV